MDEDKKSVGWMQPGMNREQVSKKENMYYAHVDIYIFFMFCVY